MSNESFKLENAPIIEAVLDIDCDMPPSLQLNEPDEATRDFFREEYPKFRRELVQEHKVSAMSNFPPETSIRHAVNAHQFFHDDEKQIVQLRRQGFSFNRLAPYTSLDDFLPEIERTWRYFAGHLSVIQARVIRLRYINRFVLPPGNHGTVDLDEYLSVAPRLPDHENLQFSRFLNQYSAGESTTGNEVNVVITSQPHEDEGLPIILDITAARAGAIDPTDWQEIRTVIESLRILNNRLFRGTITEKCLEFFK